MQVIESLTAGAIGASALTAVHETARHTISNSPRVQLIGMRAIEQWFLSPLGVSLTRNQLYGLSIAGDLISNGLGYAAITALYGNDKKQLYIACAAYGAAVGIATWMTPPYVGLGQQPTANKTKTSSLTVLWYVLGGLAAATAYTLMNRTKPVIAATGTSPGVFTETFELTVTEV